MENFPSSEDALENLKNRGYNTDLDSDAFCLYCGDLDLRLNPEAYHVDEKFEFEESAPGHPSEVEEVLAITYSTGAKGFIVDIHDTNNGQG